MAIKVGMVGLGCEKNQIDGEILMAKLKKAGLVESTRGAQGGYRLGKPGDQISVGDILRLTEGGLAPVACLENNPIQCERAEMCSTLFIWKGLNDVVNRYLDSITIQDIVDRSLVNESFDYII